MAFVLRHFGTLFDNILFALLVSTNIALGRFHIQTCRPKRIESNKRPVNKSGEEKINHLSNFDGLYSLILQESNKEVHQNLVEKFPPAWRKILLDTIAARAKHAKKIPTFIDSNCEIELKSAEQASPEPVAQARFSEKSGHTALDLTAGLGVDTLVLSRRFSKVTALEKNREKAERLRRNLDRMGVGNVNVIESTAEEYLANGLREEVNFIYVDPDRRSTGAKKSDWKTAEPNLAEILLLCPNEIPVWAKISPAYDWIQAQRDFPELNGVEATSWQNETKEIILKFENRNSNSEFIELKARSFNKDSIGEFKCMKGKEVNFENITCNYIDRIEFQNIFLLDFSSSIRTLHLEADFLKELNATAGLTGPHGWYLTTAAIKSDLLKTNKIINWKTGTLAELRSWLTESDYKPSILHTRGIQTDAEQIIKKWSIRSGDLHPMWIGASLKNKYFLAVGAID